MSDLPPLVLLTDFGLADAYVGVMKGVIAGIHPAIRVIDLCHAVPPQDIAHGADLLAESWRWFPAGSVFVGVVDPGVGGKRGAIVARIQDRFFVGPDNGLCARVDPEDTDARTLPDAWGLPKRSATFHGRDLFAPAAARLLAGLVRFDDALPTAFVALPVLTAGVVRRLDRFGNAITNLPGQTTGFILWRELALPVVRTYGDAPAGSLVALTGSSGWLEIVAVGGSAAEAGVAPGDTAEWQP